MTEGISKDRLLQIGTGYMSGNALNALIRDECKELDLWIPIDENTPRHRDLLVYAPAYQDLRSLKQVCRWHVSAGFCIDELRTPTHYKELPEDPV